MKAPRFERAKVARLINTAGKEYGFSRNKLNEYNEATEEAVSIAVVKGVYRNTSSGHISITRTEAASVRIPKIPMIIALWDDNVKNIQQNDFTIINGRKMYVTGVENIGEWNLFAEISLSEVVAGGI